MAPDKSRRRSRPHKRPAPSSEAQGASEGKRASHWPQWPTAGSGFPRRCAPPAGEFGGYARLMPGVAPVRRPTGSRATAPFRTHEGHGIGRVTQLCVKDQRPANAAAIPTRVTVQSHQHTQGLQEPGGARNSCFDSAADAAAMAERVASAAQTPATWNTDTAAAMSLSAVCRLMFIWTAALTPKLFS